MASIVWIDGLALPCLSFLLSISSTHTPHTSSFLPTDVDHSICLAVYSCLESPMDGGAWWSAVHGVAKSQTPLSGFTFTFHFHALEKEMATHSSVLAWRIPETGEPGGLPSMGSHRVGHDWSNLVAAAAADEPCLIFWWKANSPHLSSMVSKNILP